MLINVENTWFVFWCFSPPQKTKVIIKFCSNLSITVVDGVCGLSSLPPYLWGPTHLQADWMIINNVVKSLRSIICRQIRHYFFYGFFLESLRFIAGILKL